MSTVVYASLRSRDRQRRERPEWSVRELQACHERPEAWIVTDAIKRRLDLRPCDVERPLVKRLGEPLEATIPVSQREIGDGRFLIVKRSVLLLDETVQDLECVSTPPKQRIGPRHIRRFTKLGAVVYGQRLLWVSHRVVGRAQQQDRAVVQRFEFNRPLQRSQRVLIFAREIQNGPIKEVCS